MTKLDAIHNYATSKKLTDDEGIKELINLASDAIKNSNDTEVNKAYTVLESLKNLNLYDGDIELTQDTETETWTYLMFKNIPTLKFTIGHNKWVILNEGYLPFYLRSVIKNVTASDTETLNIAINNWDLFIGFAASRVIAMDRAHAKAILGHWGFSDLDSPQIKASLAIKCNLLSTEDKYWICTDPEKVRWEDVDITTKPTHETIIALALQGRSSLIKDALAIPELTTRGIFPKAWVRTNGKLYLYKDHMYGFPDSIDIEVSVSKILDALKIRHIHYDKIQYNGMMLSCCENMTTPNLSRVSAKN